MCVWVYAHTHTHTYDGICRSRKGASDPLEKESRRVVSHHVGARTQTPFLNHQAISLEPISNSLT